MTNKLIHAAEDSLEEGTVGNGALIKLVRWGLSDAETSEQGCKGIQGASHTGESQLQAREQQVDRSWGGEKMISVILKSTEEKASSLIHRGLQELDIFSKIRNQCAQCLVFT